MLTWARFTVPSAGVMDKFKRETKDESINDTSAPSI